MERRFENDIAVAFGVAGAVDNVPAKGFEKWVEEVVA